MTGPNRFAHGAVAGASVDMTGKRRPIAGPIALLPNTSPHRRFAAAVEAGGGTVGSLGADTRGIVWLANDHPDGLVNALREHPQIQWVQLPWAGVDAFAEALAENDRDDLLWTSAKGAYAQPVAEHALALSLATLRMLPGASTCEQLGRQERRIALRRRGDDRGGRRHRD